MKRFAFEPLEFKRSTREGKAPTILVGFVPDHSTEWDYTQEKSGQVWVSVDNYSWEIKPEDFVFEMGEKVEFCQEELKDLQQIYFEFFIEFHRRGISNH